MRNIIMHPHHAANVAHILADARRVVMAKGSTNTVQMATACRTLLEHSTCPAERLAADDALRQIARGAA